MVLTAFTQVPVIDLSPFRSGSSDERDAVAADIDDALRHVGFLGLTGHGVDPVLIQSLIDLATEFFALPVATKMAVHRRAGGDPGYYPLESSVLAQSLDDGSPPDLKEAFGVGPLDRPPAGLLGDPVVARWFPENRWPAEPAGFAEVWQRYYRAMEVLSTTLLEAFALALRLPASYFEQHARHHTSTASVIHYPAQHAPPVAGQLRAGAHTDYGTFTVLHKVGAARGLQVRNRDGDWIDVRPPSGGFIVNVGDLMARWTNDRWVSTMHRVVNPAGADARSAEMSIPYFHQPDHDCVVMAVPSGHADGPARYAPVRAGDHLAAKVDKMHDLKVS
jgi:isopenicillin N synthase-like dioxygenase